MHGLYQQTRQRFRRRTAKDDAFGVEYRLDELNAPAQIRGRRADPRHQHRIPVSRGSRQRLIEIRIGGVHTHMLIKRGQRRAMLQRPALALF